MRATPQSPLWIQGQELELAPWTPYPPGPWSWPWSSGHRRYCSCWCHIHEEPHPWRACSSGPTRAYSPEVWTSHPKSTLDNQVWRGSQACILAVGRLLNGLQCPQQKEHHLGHYRRLTEKPKWLLNYLRLLRTKKTVGCGFHSSGFPDPCFPLSPHCLP